MQSEQVEVLPLPELPPSQQGTSTASSGTYKATVSNAAGYLCHIKLQCRFEVKPEVVFEVFSHPDNAGAFRDIKRVGYRKVVEASPGFKRVEVEQVGELRVMWVVRQFKTYLLVTEDSRDPECLKTDFTLLRSDVLSRFHGAWELRPVQDSSSRVVACDAVLTQDVLPRGCPSFFARLPVLGGLLRQVSLGTIKRLVEDLLHIVKKYNAGNGTLSVGDVLVQIAAERGHKTILEQNRPQRISEQDEATAGSSSSRRSSKHHHKGTAGNASSGSNSSSAKARNVTSFAVDDIAESDDSMSQKGLTEGLGRCSHASEGSSSSSIKAAAASCLGSSATQQQQPQLSGPAAVLATTPAANLAATAAEVASQNAAAYGVTDLPDGEQERHCKRGEQRHMHIKQVGMVLDVSEHGHVSVVLVPREL